MTMVPDPTSSVKCGVIEGASIDLVGMAICFDLRLRTAWCPPRCLIVEMRILRVSASWKADLIYRGTTIEGEESRCDCEM